MTATNGWPGEPGVPLNPESDGWHWLKAHPDNLKATRLEKFPAHWNAANRHWIHGTYPPEYAAENWIYLGPCLTPTEIARLRADLAALQRDASQEIATDEMVRRLQHLGDWQAADRIDALQKRVAKLEGVLRDLMLPQTPASFAGSMRRARAALGGKDE